ncbi:hypothetical protein SAMN05421636_10459 [Pricia antarctica]|uniref:Uncharacterized protein n=1 Tax=Pricia antarctica TaxID=641691 RepID=A0A1G7B993_9FLAO|nr:hypothetical protein SAMN05421636_10459 [Pricia antarctica]
MSKCPYILYGAIKMPLNPRKPANKKHPKFPEVLLIRFKMRDIVLGWINLAYVLA